MRSRAQDGSLGPPGTTLEQGAVRGRRPYLHPTFIWCRKSVRGLVQIAKDKPTSSGFTLTQVKWFAVTRLECHTPPFLCHNYPFKERSQKKGILWGKFPNGGQYIMTGLLSVIA